MFSKDVVFLFITIAAYSQGFLWSPSKVCYGKYGCFQRYNSLVKLPKSPSEVGTTFHMFTRDGSGIVDDEDQSKLTAPKFDINRRTIFVIHGYTDNKDNYDGMKDALLKREDCHVVLVDWYKGARILYGQAAGNAQLVGAQVAELIKFLISSSSGSPDLAENFYIVGMSLGAQTAGYAGAYLKARHRMNLGRITGPLFTSEEAQYRLDPSDAKYVDVIHTDAWGLGTGTTVGHTDFWPNGGLTQPGCIPNIINIFDLGLKDTVICEHKRAFEYYFASIQNLCSWKAFPCINYSDFKAGKCLQCDGECPTLGYGADETKKPGNHYLKTNSEAPFCGLN